MESIQQSASFKIRIISRTTRIEEQIYEGAERTERYKQPRRVCEMGEATKAA
jgi:hypothetical protein